MSLKSFSTSLEPALNRTTCPDSDDEHQCSFCAKYSAVQHAARIDSNESERSEGPTEAERDNTGSSW